MPPFLSSLTSRLAARAAASRLDVLCVALIALMWIAALALMYMNEGGYVANSIFLLTWGLLNCFWLMLLGRPVISTALSLGMIVLIMLLSHLKFSIVWMTANFLDVWIVNSDTFSYLLAVKPHLYRDILIATALILPVLGFFWWFDTLRVRRTFAVAGFLLCVAGVTNISLSNPQEEWEVFFPDAYVSKFVRSGVYAVSALAQGGYMESAAKITERLRTVPDVACTPEGKPPHIILVHDESSFDVRVLPGVKVPDGYGAHFRSFDGKARRFIAEGAGGPSWYTEYNVLAGLSARSFGRFAYYVTHIAAGRVERGLPKTLRRCGYQTFSIYPASGAFMSARAFQTTAGMQRFSDQTALGTNRIEPDEFYYDAALRMIERERSNAPMFLFVYLAQNHYPWDYRWRPDLKPEWKDPGNLPLVDEYLRRQALSAQDYASFLERLKHDYPDESFLLVRYGDHQPEFASTLMEPWLDDTARAKRLMRFDPRYFTTYYAIDAINHKPKDLSSALDTIEGPYLPLIVQEAAGLPLDPSFAEQKRVQQRCKGLFYACAGGAEARRFNRMLIDAGLIKGL